MSIYLKVAELVKGEPYGDFELIHPYDGNCKYYLHNEMSIYFTKTLGYSPDNTKDRKVCMFYAFNLRLAFNITPEDQVLVLSAGKSLIDVIQESNWRQVMLGDIIYNVSKEKAIAICRLFYGG